MCASVIPFIPSLNDQNQLSILKSIRNGHGEEGVTKFMVPLAVFKKLLAELYSYCVCLFVLGFYGPVKNEVMSSRSINSGTVPGQA